MDPGIVAEADHGCLAAAGVKTKDVVTAVGGRDVIIKKIQIERVKEQQARELMRWEAEQHVPFDMESVELDFQILDPDGDGMEMNVLLVAAKRELIESKTPRPHRRRARARDRGRRRFALHNAFEINHPDAMNGVVGLVNIGHEVTNINILDDGRPDAHARHHGRDAPLPRRPPARARPHGGRGAGAHSGIRPLAASRRGDRGRGEEIAVGIERAAAFLAQSSRGGQVRAIYRAAAARAFRGSTTRWHRLNITVQQANPLANLKVRDGALESLVTDEIAPLLMLPIGWHCDRSHDRNQSPARREQEDSSRPALNRWISARAAASVGACATSL